MNVSNLLLTKRWHSFRFLSIVFYNYKFVRMSIDDYNLYGYLLMCMDAYNLKSMRIDNYVCMVRF